ncbi:MAG: hypothetical protein JF616_04470 [Fibrobacteres bacterium]|jgi:hypothetical protein|nr:hypothetical protein [Fibrobacterota bacterium]
MRSITPFAAMLLIAFSAAHSREIRMGAVELSGQGSYMMSGGDAISQTALLVRPSAAVYLSQYINFGPVFSWERYHTEEKDFSLIGGGSYESTSSMLSISAKAGILANYTELVFRPLPFFDMSAGPEINSRSGTGSSDYSKMGAVFTGTLGTKFKLSDSFLFAAFFSIEDHSLLHYEILDTFGFGFSGVI